MEALKTVLQLPNREIASVARISSGSAQDTQSSWEFRHAQMGSLACYCVLTAGLGRFICIASTMDITLYCIAMPFPDRNFPS
jgi:hypothetical protein